MNPKFSFTDLLAEVTEHNLILTSQSLDKLYGIMEHLCQFGSLADYPELEPNHAMALLAATFATARNYVLIDERSKPQTEWYEE